MAYELDYDYWRVVEYLTASPPANGLIFRENRQRIRIICLTATPTQLNITFGSRNTDPYHFTVPATAPYNVLRIEDYGHLIQGPISLTAPGVNCYFYEFSQRHSRRGKKCAGKTTELREIHNSNRGSTSQAIPLGRRLWDLIVTGGRLRSTPRPPIQ